MLVAAPDEVIRIEHEVWFDTFQYGSDVAIPNGQITIQRSSDGLYWNGATWGALTQVATTIDVSGVFHSYDFDVGAVDGESYTVRMRVHGDQATEVVFGILVRESGGAVTLEPTLDAVGFATGIPFTVRVVP